MFGIFRHLMITYFFVHFSPVFPHIKPTVSYIRLYHWQGDDAIWSLRRLMSLHVTDPCTEEGVEERTGRAADWRRSWPPAPALSRGGG